MPPPSPGVVLGYMHFIELVEESPDCRMACKDPNVSIYAEEGWKARGDGEDPTMQALMFVCTFAH